MQPTKPGSCRADLWTKPISPPKCWVTNGPWTANTRQCRQPFRDATTAKTCGWNVLYRREGPGPPTTVLMSITSRCQ